MTLRPFPLLSFFFLIMRRPSRSTLFPFPTLFFFFFNDTATTEIYTLSLHDALPIWALAVTDGQGARLIDCLTLWLTNRSEEHTSELQSLTNLVCRLLLENERAHV